MTTKEITDFLDKFLEKMKETGIDLSGYTIDHVGYQASSTEEYEKKKIEFGNLVHEAVVADRRVGVFKYNGNGLLAIELIEPRPGQKCKSGWEHAEYVIDEPFEKLVTRYKNLSWDTSSVNRPIYSHLKLKLTDDMQVKFHLMDILATIELDTAV